MSQQENTAYPLRILGTDTTRPMPRVQSANLAKPFDGGSQYQQAAQETLNRGYDTLSKGNEIAAQISQQVTENAITSVDVRSKAQLQIAQYAGAHQQKRAEVLGRLGELFQGLDKQRLDKKRFEAEQQQQQIEDARKEEELAFRRSEEQRNAEDHILKRFDEQERRTHEANNAVTTEELEALGVRAPEIIRDFGPGEYERQVRETLARRRLAPDDYARLATSAYTPLDTELTRQRGVQQKNMEQLQNNQTDQAISNLRIALATNNAQIQNAEGDITPLIEQRQKIVSAFYTQNPGLSLVQVSAIEASYTQDLAKRVQDNVDKSTLVGKELANRENFMNEALQLQTKYRNGEIDVTQFNYHISQLATRYGIPQPQAEALADPTAPERAYYDHLEREQKLQQLESQGLVSELDRVQVNEWWIADQAYKMATDPVYRSTIENHPELSKVQVYKNAGALADKYNEFEAYRPKYQQERANLVKQLAAWNSATAKPGASSSDLMEMAVQMNLPPEALAQLQQQQIGTGDPAQNQADWERARQMGAQAIIDQITAKDQEFARMQSVLAPYGMDKGPEGVASMQATYKDNIKQQQTLFQNARPQSTAPDQGATPNFNQGRSSNVSFRTVNDPHTGRPIRTPFAANANVTVTSGYGDAGSPRHGRRRHHAGIDLAAPAGTPILAMADGVVVQAGNLDPDGYGNMVDIRLADGTILRHAHLQGISVRQGQQIRQGQVLGKVGDTGNSKNNFHLHFEVRNPGGAQYGLEGTRDPHEWLTGSAPTTQPRGDTRAYNSDYNPYDTTSNPTRQPKPVPKGATLLAGGYYYYQGKIESIYDDSSQPATYNRANPVRNSAVPSDKNSFNPARDNKPGNNYGYNALARDPSLARSLNATATRLGIPAQWLADVIAFESGFKPAEDNGLGYTGLIQFGDAAAQDMGTTRSQLARMTPAQQMKYVEKYLAKFGSQRFVSPFHVLMAIWGGEGGLRRLERGGFASVRNMSDGYITFERYSLRLGEGAGRRYVVPGSDRRNRVASNVHTGYHPGCTVCNQMVANNPRILPHEPQYSTNPNFA